MRTRASRPLKELYDRADRISEPEPTCPADKRYTFMSGKFCTRADSGTCNVCSAPCSSCMHLNRTASVMESKMDCLFSGNTFGRKGADSYPFAGVDVPPFYKGRACDDHQPTASESSNFPCASSSHDSCTENADSKVTMKASVIYDASDAVDMSPKVSSSAATGDDRLLPKKTNVAAHNLFSRYNITSDLCHKTYLSPNEEQRRLECHGDNISCITGVIDANVTVLDHNVDSDKKDVACSSAATSSLRAKGIEDAAQVEAAPAFYDFEIEDNQSNSRCPSTCHAESLGKEIAGCSSTIAGLYVKSEHVEFPPSKNILSLKAHSQKGGSFHDNAGSKDLNRNSSSQLQEHLKCSMENVESSLRPPLATGSANEESWAVHLNYEDSKSSHLRGYNPSVALKDTDPVETANGKGHGISSDEVMKCSTIIKQLENPTSFMEACNVKGPRVQPQLTTNSENFESDSGLIDVKVCDICGDAGREELLAICSRCSDGAEHIYCMKKILYKLPEGDWLCEECEDKEKAENQKADKSEMVSGSSKLIYSNANRRNFTSTSLPKLDTEVVDAEATWAIKGLQSPQISATRCADNLVDSSITIKANGGSAGASSTRKKIVLSCETSFKNLDMGKVQPAILGSSCGSHSANNSPAVSCLQTSLGSSSSKAQAKFQSPRVPVSRSNSFNTSNYSPSPKVQPLIGNVPYNLKMARQSTSGDTRKVGLLRTITKSASFKSVTSSRYNIDSVGKTQSLNPSRREDPSGSKQEKVRNVIEKNSSVLDHPIVSSSTTASNSIPHPKVDLKVSQHDGKRKNSFESKILSTNKRSDDANVIGCKEVKKQLSYLSKSFGSQSSNGMRHTEDQNPCQVSKDRVHASSAVSDRSYSKAVTVLQRSVAQGSESTLHDDKNIESTIFSSSKQPVSVGHRRLHCQICNETGHATQSCSVDKLSKCALKTSEEQNLRDGIRKSKKWKDAVDATDSESRIQKNNRLPGLSEKSSMPSANLSYGVTSKDLLSSSSSCSKDLPFLEGTRTDGQDILGGSDADPSKTAAVTGIRQHPMHPAEASYLSTANNFLTVSDGSYVRPSMQTLSDQASIVVNPLKASAIPELEFIWKGGFDVLRTGRLPERFDGIQAHVSTCAPRKVLEVATKFPCIVELEEDPCISSWPLLFQGTNPKEDDIDLFFFAKDIESYEKSYMKLLENMLTNDLALRGNIDGIELLVFPSNRLPVNSQRWNKLFFLWGVLRGRINCFEALPGSLKKPCGSILSTDPLGQELPSLPTNGASKSQNIDSCDSLDMELSRCDRSSKVKAVISTTSVDYLSASSGVDDTTSSIEVFPHVGSSFYQTAVDNTVPSEHTSSSFAASCSLIMMNQLPSSFDTRPGPKLQLRAKIMCREENVDNTYLKNLGADYDGRKFAEPLTFVHPNNLQTDPGALPAYRDSSNYRLGSEGRRNDGKMKPVEKSVKSEAATIEDDTWKNPTGINDRRWEPRPEKYPERSCSVETVVLDSGETSKSTDETKMEKANHISIDGGREQKKLRSYSEGHGSSGFKDDNPKGRSSSKVHPLLDCFRDVPFEERAMPESSIGAERSFFPVELGPLKDTKRDVHVVSSDDEDSPPNLELALGGKKKSAKPKATPLPFPFTPAKIIEDAASDSLSLSLGLPSSGGTLKRMAMLPDRPGTNTSLLLFSGFSDT